MIRTGSGEITPKVEDVESSNIGAIWRGRTDGRMMRMLVGTFGRGIENKMEGKTRKKNSACQKRKERG